MKKGIIYGRKSTNKQSSESIETQIYECEKWAKENDCLIVDIYDDSGQSGRAYNVGNRSGFHQILQDAKEGRMDYALIHKVDRFARSVLNYYTQEAELAKYGVQLIVVGMPFMQNADIVSKSVHISMAEQFSNNLSNEVSSKMRTFARKGAFLGGKPPYGFKVVQTEEGKTLKINEDEAAGIRLIYDLYIQSYGYIQISKILHKKGFSNGNGNPFTASHVRKMLTSKKYNGWYVFGIREKVNGKEVKTNDKEKLIEIPDVYDKIITDEVFQAVQKKLGANEVKNKRRIRYYPFTGLTTCGCCGRAVTGYCTVKADRKKTVYTYYRCTGRKVYGCTLPSVNADTLENYVYEKIRLHLFDDAFTERLVSEIEAHLSGDINSYKSMRKMLEKDLQDLKNQIKEATRDKYSKKIDDDIYEELITEFDQKKTALETRLSDVIKHINVSDKTAEIRKYVQKLKNGLDDVTQEVRFAFLKEVVQSIVINPNKITVYVNISTPPVKTRLYGDRLPNVAHSEPRKIST